MTQTWIDTERDALLSSLTNQREHVLGILEGLSDDDLRRPVLASGWTVAPDVPVETVFALYRQEIDLANVIITGSSIDTPPAAWPEKRWPDWRFHNLREMLLHVITETAVHAGHLDAVRELIDGRQWLVLG